MRISICLLGVFLALTLGGCGSDEATTSDTSAPSLEAAPEPDTAPANPNESAANTGAKIGEDYFLQDSSGNQFDIALVDYQPNVNTHGDRAVPPSKGNKWVGVEIEISGGETVYDDAPSNGATLIDTDDNQYESPGSLYGSSCPGAGSVRVTPGGSRKVCMPFEVPEDAVMTTFQFALDSGFADSYGEWTLEQR